MRLLYTQFKQLYREITSMVFKQYRNPNFDCRSLRAAPLLSCNSPHSIGCWYYLTLSYHSKVLSSAAISIWSCASGSTPFSSSHPSYRPSFHLFRPWSFPMRHRCRACLNPEQPGASFGWPPALVCFASRAPLRPSRRPPRRCTLSWR